MPIPLPQSLAKMIAFESKSHAGEVLLQFPPVRGSAVLLAASRSQICLGPLSVDSKATHFPSGEATELATTAEFAKNPGATLRVDGSNAMIVEDLCATSSK